MNLSFILKKWDDGHTVFMAIPEVRDAWPDLTAPEREQIWREFITCWMLGFIPVDDNGEFYDPVEALKDLVKEALK